MKKLFDELSYKISKSTTRKYSTSFSLGILALNSTIRKDVYAIYGYVRLADEIVDSFHGYDRKKLLSRFRKETDTALKEKIALNPILQSFQETVNKYNIDHRLIEEFLNSMEMDLNSVDYNSQRYEEYIYGSAEVVGMMCLYVFTEGDQEKYASLKSYAKALGSAFQKVNFLRDLKDDYHILGRVYFPHIQINNFNKDTKNQIEREVEQEFKEALIGIKMLPNCSKFGVFLAYKYYLSLFNKIKNTRPEKILEKRIRIANTKKMSLTFWSFLLYKTKLY